MWAEMARQRARMRTITLHLHYPPADMPAADTDVLIFDASRPEGTLGAYQGEDTNGPIWVAAQGEGIADVVAWCEMPRLPAAPAARELVLRGSTLAQALLS